MQGLYYAKKILKRAMNSWWCYCLLSLFDGITIWDMLSTCKGFAGKGNLSDGNKQSPEENGVLWVL